MKVKIGNIDVGKFAIREKFDEEAIKDWINKRSDNKDE